MILKFALDKRHTLFVHQDTADLGVVVDEYFHDPAKNNSTCVWSRKFTAGQAKELKKFLEAKGY